MARTHARVKGKSGSKRPVEVDMSFVTIKPKEVEKLIVELGKQDKRASEIGLVLRDSYGVANVKKYVGKSISKILDEAKVSFRLPEDLQALVNKVNILKKHLDNNRKDLHNRRGLQLLESKVRRLSNYYKRVGRLPTNWRMN